MEPVASLRLHEPRSAPRSVVLVLHGGRARSLSPTHPWNGAVLRMVPFARSLARAGDDDGLVVARLRYLIRGWNGQLQSPVADARSALARLARRYPGLPVALVGHSMGGRVAFTVADSTAVRVVVALAPWVEDYDPVDHLASRRLLIAHGTHDRVTDPAASAAFADRARAAGAQVTYLSVGETSHAMLRRAGLWHDITTQFALRALSETTAREADDGAVTNLVERALAGERTLVV